MNFNPVDAAVDDSQKTMPVSSFTTYNLSEDEYGTLLKQAKKNNDVNAAFRLYQYYAFCTENKTAMLEFLIISAHNGNNVAQHNLAYLYFTEGRFDEAYDWAQKAKLNGNNLSEELIKEIDLEIEKQKKKK